VMILVTTIALLLVPFCSPMCTAHRCSPPDNRSANSASHCGDEPAAPAAWKHFHCSSHNSCAVSDQPALLRPSAAANTLFDERGIAHTVPSRMPASPGDSHGPGLLRRSSIHSPLSPPADVPTVLRI